MPMNFSVIGAKDSVLLNQMSEEISRHLQDLQQTLGPIKLQKYESTSNLMSELTGISAPYMQVLSPFIKVTEAHIKALKAEKSDAANADIKILETAKQGLINIFLEDVAAKRLAVLIHENNYKHALGVGANNTIYTSPDFASDDPLASVKVLVTQRHIGKPDGIGPFGGLGETLNKLFTDFYFDEKRFNEKDPEFLAILKEESSKREAGLSKLPDFMKLAAQYQLDGLNLLINIAETNNHALEKDLAKYIDDARFNEANQLERITDVNIISYNIASRELGEEVPEGVQAALLDMLRSKISSEIALGGNESNILDWNYILRIFNIAQDKAVAQVVGPIMRVTEVPAESMDTLLETMLANPGAKLINPSSHMEVSKIIVTDLAQLRRSSGFTDEFAPGSKTDLSIAVGKNNPVYGEYAYRYPHESLVPLVITMRIAHQITKDIEHFRARLIELAAEDQRAVFSVDHRDHEMSNLSKAKLMFANDLKSAIDKDHLAYELLANEITRGSQQLTGYVDGSLLHEMDVTYHTVHEEMSLAGAGAL